MRLPSMRSTSRKQVGCPISTDNKRNIIVHRLNAHLDLAAVRCIPPPATPHPLDTTITASGTRRFQ